jgi:hypothetical protein
MIQHQITVVGLDRFESLMATLPDVTTKAASMAINDAARKGRAESKREILKQVNFPSGYLGGERGGRLEISQYANESRLKSVITGRFQATSLVRFVSNMATLTAKGTPGSNFMGRGKARVQVKPGSMTVIDKAYLMRLKNGNMGFAYRPGKGGMRNTVGAKALGTSGWYLLYGPSVNQVFNDVREDVAPSISSTLNSEFDRQFRRLTRGR